MSENTRFNALMLIGNEPVPSRRVTNSTLEYAGTGAGAMRTFPQPQGGIRMKDLPIWVTEVATNDKGTKGLFSTSADAVLKRVSVDKLRANLSETCQSVATLLKEIRDDLGKVGGFKLKQVEIQVEINAEGGVELVGTAKVGAKGAITLTFGE